ncbi:MAG: hypothetical protein IPM84_25940 [Anaerolineae bacterium]|nr:hypothetical protein [Anaerolineae bacterium]
MFSSFQTRGVNVRAQQKNVIGGMPSADRNVISGNRFCRGVRIEGNLALTNTVQGNLIGPALDGAAVLA